MNNKKDDLKKLLARDKQENIDYQESLDKAKEVALRRMFDEIAHADLQEKRERDVLEAAYADKPPRTQEEMAAEFKMRRLKDFIKKQKLNRLPASELSSETSEMVDKLEDAENQEIERLRKFYSNK